MGRTAAGWTEPGAPARLPRVPAWVQVALVGAVVATWRLTAWVAQQLFPGDAPRDYILAAIPTYFLLMGVERLLLAVYAKGTAPARYDAVDTWASLTAGLVQQLVSRAFSACVGKFLLPYLTYTYIWRHFALTHPDPKAWTTTALCLLATDFCYYWSAFLLPPPRSAPLQPTRLCVCDIVMVCLCGLVCASVHRCGHTNALLWAGHQVPTLLS
jgi:hypothetical protein